MLGWTGDRFGRRKVHGRARAHAHACARTRTRTHKHTHTFTHLRTGHLRPAGGDGEVHLHCRRIGRRCLHLHSNARELLLSGKNSNTSTTRLLLVLLRVLLCEVLLVRVLLLLLKFITIIIITITITITIIIIRQDYRQHITHSRPALIAPQDEQGKEQEQEKEKEQEQETEQEQEQQSQKLQMLARGAIYTAIHIPPTTTAAAAYPSRPSVASHCLAWPTYVLLLIIF